MNTIINSEVIDTENFIREVISKNINSNVYKPVINTGAINLPLFSDANPNITNTYFMFGTSIWGEGDIFLEKWLHNDCVITTNGTNPRGIFSLNNSNYFSANDSAYIKIKYPYNISLYKIGFLFDSENYNVRLYGSLKTTPSLTILSNYNITSFIDYLSITGMSTTSGLTLTGSSGEWISNPIEFDPIFVDSINYYGTFPSNTTTEIYYRTSFDQLNWTPWSKLTKDLTLSGTITNPISGTGSLLISGNIENVTVDNITNEIEYISGSHVLFGTATSDNFYRYKIQYATGLKNETLTDLIGWQSSPVDDGTLYTLDTTTLIDGSYCFQLLVEDTSGNQSSDTCYAIIDNTHPTASITYPVASENVSGNVGIYANISDTNIKEWILSIDGVVKESGTTSVEGLIYTLDTTNYTGSVVASLFVEDLAGNTTTDSVTFTVNQSWPCITDISIDKNMFSNTRGNPLIISYSLSINSDVTIKVYDDDNTLIKTILNGVSKTAGNNTSTWDGTNNSSSVVIDGTYTIKIDAVASGNSATQKTKDVIIYNTAPTAIITSPTSSALIGMFNTISGTASDLASYFDYYILEYGTGASPTSWIEIYTGTKALTSNILAGWNTYNLTKGTYTIRLRVYDIYGVYSEDTVTISVIDDPEAFITVESPGSALLAISGIIPNTQELTISGIIEGNTDELDICGTIQNASSLDISGTIISANTVDISQLDIRNYIQFKIKMSDNGGGKPNITTLSIIYSNDWYALIPNTTCTGTSIISFNPTELKHLYIDIQNEAIKLYQMQELYNL